MANAQEKKREIKRKGIGTIEEISLPNEEWRDIPIDELKGLYFISSFGINHKGIPKLS